jgi:hypothetical protein
MPPTHVANSNQTDFFQYPVVVFAKPDGTGESATTAADNSRPKAWQTFAPQVTLQAASPGAARDAMFARCEEGLAQRRGQRGVGRALQGRHGRRPREPPQ